MSPSLIQPSFHDLEDPSHELFNPRSGPGHQPISLLALKSLLGDFWCSPPIRWLEGLWYLWEVFLRAWWQLCATASLPWSFWPHQLPHSSPNTPASGGPDSASIMRWLLPCAQHPIDSRGERRLATQRAKTRDGKKFFLIQKSYSKKRTQVLSAVSQNARCPRIHASYMQVPTLHSFS